MSRINTNVPSLIARSNLDRAQQGLQLRLQRLSTGLRINRGADDPAGLIISERIRSDVRGVEQGVKNAERASAVIATAEGAMAEVNELLNSIKALVVEAANSGAFSDEELNANQLQIDSAIDSITRISNSASFGGLKLLDGSLDYQLSGISASAVSRAQVFGASFVSSDALQVDVEIVASAQVGALFVRGDYNPPNNVNNGTVLSSTTLRVSGPRGVAEITVLSGASLAAIVTAVNNSTQLTGVEADQINATDITSGLVFRSIDFGSDSFVSVKRLNPPPDAADDYFQTYSLADNAPLPAFPPFDWTTLLSSDLTEDDYDNGKDVQALINGSLATGDGLNVSINSPQLSLKLLLNQDLATSPASITTFYITGGGALFQLGPEVTAQQQSNIGVQSLASSNLGGTLVDGALQFLSSLKSGQNNSLKDSDRRRDFTSASDILEAAIDEVSILRGRMGAFERNVLQTNVRSLQTAIENLRASDSAIRDADFAAETSELTRSQILASAGTSVLALANAQSQSVLQLLG